MFFLSDIYSIYISYRCFIFLKSLGAEPMELALLFIIINNNSLALAKMKIKAININLIN